MSPIIFIDTNVILYLARGNLNKISKNAKRVLSDVDLYFSPMVRLELEYLYEISRITHPATEVFHSLEKAISINESQSNFSDVCAHACKIGWTRDTFDRIIVAEAALHKAKLVTADEKILKNYKHAVW